MKVNVSTLNEFEFCPRKVYLQHVLKVAPEWTMAQAHSFIGYALRKELSMRKARLLKKVTKERCVDELVREEFACIIMDAPLIHREKLSGISIEALLPEIRREMEAELDLLSEKLEALVREHGIKRAIELLTPLKVEYALSSAASGLSGIVDKVVQPLAPVDIKTGSVGEGIWEGDRLQVCAYGMLLEEKFNQDVSCGFVEYARIQEQRPVVFTERLRRRVFETRDSVREILSGSLPEICPHGSGRKCEACGLKESCYRL
jgi:CRISPR/Cas system-associated exonuclease Cas4 (RecB family)